MSITHVIANIVCVVIIYACLAFIIPALKQAWSVFRQH